MIIGVDFDNTIVSYDALIHHVALERGLIPASVPQTKTAVRDHLRETGREDVWTEMQGEIYGPRLTEAVPYPGVLDFIARCRARGIRVVVISHKTRHPFRGPPHDLHAAARSWLQARGIVEDTTDGSVFLEVTKAEKLERIRLEQCTHFIDDLPEILSDPRFPAGVQKLWFAPHTEAVTSAPAPRFDTWAAIADHFNAELDLERAASGILAQHGRTLASGLQPLGGGANNRVFRADTSHGPVVVKRYFRGLDDRRDRFNSEQVFYRYAAECGASVPDVLGWDADAAIGVFRFSEGIRPPAATPALVHAALDFIARLNSDRTAASRCELPLAAESCFCLDAHITTVEGRLSRLSAAVAGGADPEAAEVVTGLVKPAWDAIRADMEAHSPERWHEKLPQNERCLSPSDFGFHNCIASDAKVTFFDFEYAGWDDPAKLVCDFFCQPDVPVSREAHFSEFTEKVSEILALTSPAEFEERCRRLLPVYAIKWACILLNEFTPEGRRRRQFSLGTSAFAARRVRQLAKVRALLNSLPLPV
jgi:hypothetical protein